MSEKSSSSSNALKKSFGAAPVVFWGTTGVLTVTGVLRIFLAGVWRAFADALRFLSHVFVAPQSQRCFLVPCDLGHDVH